MWSAKWRGLSLSRKSNISTSYVPKAMEKKRSFVQSSIEYFQVTKVEGSTAEMPCDIGLLWPKVLCNFGRREGKRWPGWAKTCQTQSNIEINISADKIWWLFVYETWKTFMGKRRVEISYFPVFVRGENRAVYGCQILCKGLYWNQCALCHCGWTKEFLKTLD